VKTIVWLATVEAFSALNAPVAGESVSFIAVSDAALTVFANCGAKEVTSTMATIVTPLVIFENRDPLISNILI
jgi:hypothetical protein